MKLLVFGATGPTGLQVLAQALQQGHEVSAFVRSPLARSAGIPQGLDVARVGVFDGSVTDDPAAVAEAVRGQDAVICALGRRNSFKSEHLIERSMRNIVPGMERHAVRRLILVSAMGVGASHRDAPRLPRIMYRLLLADIFADKLAAEHYLGQSSLDWTVVYPVLLTNGPRTGRYRVGERLALRGVPVISRADVADFILRQLRDAAFSRKIAVISY